MLISVDFWKSMHGFAMDLLWILGPGPTITETSQKQGLDSSTNTEYNISNTTGKTLC